MNKQWNRVYAKRGRKNLIFGGCNPIKYYDNILVNNTFKGNRNSLFLNRYCRYYNYLMNKRGRR